MHAARELLNGAVELATLPAVYARVKAVVDDPESSLTDLSQVVAADPVLTARLLRIVNSVYFGLMSRVETASHAVSILGMRQLHDIVLATAIASQFQGIHPGTMDMRRYWSNSVMRALIARAAAEAGGLRDSERLFVMGLMADIGHLVIYQRLPTQAEEALLTARETGRPLHEVERERMGCDYGEVGALLVERWQLPVRFVAAIAGQVDLTGAPPEHAQDAALLHLARVMTDGLEAGVGDPDLLARVDPAVWRGGWLKPADLPDIRCAAALNHAEVVALFFGEDER